MKNAIIYFYNMYIDDIRKLNNNYYFSFNNEDYVINRVMKELNTVVCNKENEIKEEITYTLVR